MINSIQENQSLTSNDLKTPDDQIAEKYWDQIAQVEPNENGVLGGEVFKRKLKILTILKKMTFETDSKDLNILKRIW